MPGRREGRDVRRLMRGLLSGRLTRTVNGTGHRSVVRGAGRVGAIGHADAVLNDLVRVAGLAVALLLDHIRPALALPGRSVVRRARMARFLLL